MGGRFIVDSFNCRVVNASQHLVVNVTYPYKHYYFFYNLILRRIGRPKYSRRQEGFNKENCIRN